VINQPKRRFVRDLVHIGQRYVNQKGVVREIVDLETSDDIVWFRVDSNGELSDESGGCKFASFAAWVERRA